jgi:histidinol-phosphate phosphatase family protein
VRFVGIDLAWSPRNRSGGAVLSASGRLLAATAILGGDDEVLDFITKAVPANSPGLIAVDAPLAVPNDTGARPCDRQVASVFSRFEAAPYPANRRNLGRYGGLRAEAIRQRLESLGFQHNPYIRRQAPTRQVIEVFPHPAIVSLFQLRRTLKYKARSKRDHALRWRELARLRDCLSSLAETDPPLHLTPDLAKMSIQGLRGRSFKQAEDLFDALVCAYSALYAWHNSPRGYAVYGNATQGHILVPMTPPMWSRIKTSRLLFLDRDGTLNYSLGEHPPNHPTEVRLLPGVASKLHRCTAMGWRIVIITNQGGIAFGYLTESQAHAIHRAVLNALPVEVDASYLCPHHPDGTIARYAITCPNRKPSPGAILDALTLFGAEPQNCLFVGDRDSDRLAAAAAGVPFKWAWEFFGRKPPACLPMSTWRGHAAAEGLHAV